MEIHYVPELEGNIYRYEFSPNWFINSIAFPIKIPTDFLWVEFDSLILKFIWKCKGPKTANTLLKKEKKLRDLSSRY